MESSTQSNPSKVVLGMAVTLDGFVAATDGDLSWLFRGFSPGLTEANVETLEGVGTFVMGRKTYEGMAAHWPNAAGDPIAPVMNRAEKVVLTSNPSPLDWDGARPVNGSLAEVIAELRSQPGKPIAIAGGADVAQQAVRARLADEYRLVVHPLALGAGLKLFPESVELKLVSSQQFDHGVMVNNYVPADRA